MVPLKNRKYLYNYLGIKCCLIHSGIWASKNSIFLFRASGNFSFSHLSSKRSQYYACLLICIWWPLLLYQTPAPTMKRLKSYYLLSYYICHGFQQLTCYSCILFWGILWGMYNKMNDTKLQNVKRFEFFNVPYERNVWTLSFQPFHYFTNTMS